MMNRRHEFFAELKELLKQAKSHTLEEADGLAMSGNYVNLFGTMTFRRRDDSTSRRYVVPASTEQRFHNQVYTLFDSRIRPTTVRLELGFAVYLISREKAFTFPFATHEQEQEYLDEVYKRMDFHYRKQYDAIVPLYQVKCEKGIEFPLANAVIFADDGRAFLNDVSRHDANAVENRRRQRSDQFSYLKFRVTGDTKSCLAQVRVEVERALQVLRFIYPWFRVDNVPYNPAHEVSMWKHSRRMISFLGPFAEEYEYSMFADLPNESVVRNPVNHELLQAGNEYLGLIDINHHFGQVN